MCPASCRASSPSRAPRPGLNRLDVHLNHLAQLKAATLTSCEYCIDLGAQIARRSGLTDAQLRALPRYRESGLFNALEVLVLDYAVSMSRTPVDVPEELFAQLKEHSTMFSWWS